MRDILFRGKKIYSDNSEDWIEGNLILDQHGKAHILRSNSKPIYKETSGHWYINSPCYEVDPSTVGQFTLLLDKNGKKIFEGDILRIGDETDDSINTLDSNTGIGDVEFTCSMWYVEGEINNGLYDLKQDYTNIKVIGNIHNQEL